MDLLTWDRLRRQQLTMGQGEISGSEPESELETVREIEKWLCHRLLDVFDLSLVGYGGTEPSGPCHLQEPRHPVWAGW